MIEPNIVDFLFNDDNLDDNAVDDEANHHAQPVRNENYVEVTVPQYTVSEFKNHFRMSRMAVEQLIGLVSNHLPDKHSVPIEKQVLFSIWLLAKQESFLAVGDRFNLSSGSGHYIFMNFISAVGHLTHQFIEWPNARTCNEIASRIETKYGIPGVVGAIDGTHIQIKQPTHNPVDFFNRKDVHSVVLQGICNDKLIFTDVYIGMPGRLHDARIFRNSPIYNRLVNNPALLTPQQHLLGDAAYPLLDNLLKPYRDNGHLTEVQIRFNEVMSSIRSMIERCFGLLKGKWRRLKYLDMSLADKLPQVILAACILHNFILIIDNDADNQNDNGHNGDDIGIQHAEFYEEDVGRNAEIKRDYIASLL
ncbi:hypothetical protein PPYR_01364 [Photinus pyralis]|uniref:DDE Tnp4 domain-containing protein n=2 Tax=Photinus pyralis TaxID=7054 RepID=A0A5N4B4B9_PHOPY|nr:hypothetical protein PPYR_01364 [Photinus pyralis]